MRFRIRTLPKINVLCDQNLLGTTPHALLSAGGVGATPGTRPGEAALQHGGAPVYAPIASPAPSSPATPMSTPQTNDIIPQLQVWYGTLRYLHKDIAALEQL